MKSLILILIFAIPVISYPQASVNWIQYTRGVSIAVDNSNNVFTVDYEYNPAGDIYVTKRNSAGSSLWTVKYDQTDNTKWEKAVWVETDNSGNAIVAGSLMSGYSNPVNAASILMKFDPNGNLLWRRVYETSFDGSYTRKCIVDGSGNIYVLGMGSSTQYGFVTKVKKFAPDGSTLWTYFNGGGIGAALNFKFTGDNCIVIAGRSIYGSINGFAKLDLNGNPIWSIAGISSVSVGDVAGDAFGNAYYVTSGTTIRKISPAGAEIWTRTFNIAAQRIEVGSDNLPVAAGFPNQGSFGSAFVKVDANGNQVWLNPDADGAFNLMLHAQLRMDPQNNIYLAAGTMTEMAICKVNNNGTSGWTLTMPGSYANGFDFGTDNSVYVVGGTTSKITQGVAPIPCPLPENLSADMISQTSARINWSPVQNAQVYEIIYMSRLNPSVKDAWKKKVVSAGETYAKLLGLKCNEPYQWRMRAVCDTLLPNINVVYSPMQYFTTSPCTAYDETGDASVGNEGANENTYLGSNYPNPFNPVTTIEFGLKNDSRVSVEVFNTQGKRLAVIADQFLTKGIHRAVWNGLDNNGVSQPSGVYFIRMKADGFIDARKVILSK